MTVAMAVGPGLLCDDDVIVGYVSGRAITTPSQLGPGARLRSGTVIYLGTVIGDRFESGHHVIIREECALGDDVSVWSNTVVDYGCRIGNGVKIHSNCYVAQFTEIGENAFLAPGVTIANDLYPGQAASADVMSGPHIGAGAQIGVNVTVLPFVRLGEACLIGAGSVVTRDIPPGAVAFGNPAVVHGRVDDLRKMSQRVQADPSSAARYRIVHPVASSDGPARSRDGTWPADG